MRKVRWLVVAAIGAALVMAAGALGAGPWPGLAPVAVSPSGKVRYTAVRSGFSTQLKAIRVADGAVVASKKVDGIFGIPAVTLNGDAGGLSQSGRLLVLGEPPDYSTIRARSRFLVVSTGSLAVRKRILLNGDFGYDALSPDGRTLYLIEHQSMTNAIRYAVRAYDLRTMRLVPGAIVDKREPGEKMTGMPVTRATSARGTWVYTLYMRDREQPFIHALNAANRTAFCIDVPWKAGDDVWKARLRLASGDRRLEVVVSGKTVAKVDTTTLEVG